LRVKIRILAGKRNSPDEI